MRLGVARPCVNGCGVVVEYGLDRDHRVILVESQSRAAHVCARRLLAAWVECRCGARICTYADGRVEEWPTRQAHLCPGIWAGWRATEDPPAVAPARPPRPRPTRPDRDHRTAGEPSRAVGLAI